MIEINLLPGAARKSKARASGLSLGAVAAGGPSRAKDPYLLSAIAGVVVAAAAIGGLHFTQSARANELAAREGQAVSDSARFAADLRERQRAEAQRDSALRHLRLLHANDEGRVVCA